MQIDVDSEKADAFDSSGMSEEMAAVLLKEDYTRIAEDEKMDFSLEGFYPEQESDKIFSFVQKGNVKCSRNGVSKESSPVGDRESYCAGVARVQGCAFQTNGASR